MRLHEIPGDAGLQRGPKRVGRGHGSGKGKTAGRGHKGQQSRAGAGRTQGNKEGGQMPLVRRVPKRGFTNAPFRSPHQVITLQALNRFEEGATIDLTALRARRLARRPLPVKILATGELERKGLTVHANAFSAGAQRAIEAAGGTCVIVTDKPTD